MPSSEKLLAIVPGVENPILDTKALNRYVGFVKPGMEVKVKLKTFPYQELLTTAYAVLGFGS